MTISIQIFSEYAEDAIAKLGARTGFLSIDHDFSNAAARLGMAPASLSRSMAGASCRCTLYRYAADAASD